MQHEAATASATQTPSSPEGGEGADAGGSGDAPPRARPQAKDGAGERPAGGAGERPAGDEQGRHKIFVGGVPQEMGQDDFYAFFNGIARVKRAWLQKCNTSKAQTHLPHRGFGFVIFQDAEALENLLPRGGGAGCHWDKDGILCRYLASPKGRWLEIKRATPSSKKGSGRGASTVPPPLPPLLQQQPPPQHPQHPQHPPLHVMAVHGQQGHMHGAPPFMWSPGPQQHSHHGSQSYHGPRPPHMYRSVENGDMSSAGAMSKPLLSPQMPQMAPAMQDRAPVGQGMMPMGMWMQPGNAQPYYNGGDGMVQCGMMPPIQGMLQPPTSPSPQGMAPYGDAQAGFALPLPQGMHGYAAGLSPAQAQPPR